MLYKGASGCDVVHDQSSCPVVGFQWSGGGKENKNAYLIGSGYELFFIDALPLIDMYLLGIRRTTSANRIPTSVVLSPEGPPTRWSSPAGPLRDVI